MARPKSDEKREAILEAAIEAIAEQGLGASTATIAKLAGVAQGSLFNYFETKGDLLNAAYLHLKAELNQAVLEGLPNTVDDHTQLHHLWTRWLDWGTSQPGRRRALARLGVSEEITDASRALSHERSAAGIEIVQRTIAAGALKDQSIGFVAGIIEAFAGTTMDHMISDPERADAYRATAFDSLWKALR